MSLPQPRHKKLGKEFLETFLTFLKQNDYILKDSINQIIYDDEEFYITEIKITNKPLNLKIKTYKDIWSVCDNSEPVPDYCHCNSEEQQESDEDEKEQETEENKKDEQDGKEEEISIVQLKNIKIDTNEENINVKYFSQPAVHTHTAGGQFKWVMIFNYSNENININLEIGPRRYIKYKGITGWKYNGPAEFEPSYKIDDNMLVYNYMPNDLYFDDEFYQTLKNCLISDLKQITYKSRTYKVIDYRCCNVDYADFSCGCCYNSCTKMSRQQSIDKFPLKSGLRSSFHFSCTPEWYLQVQIASCNGYSGYCYRFILDAI